MPETNENITPADFNALNIIFTDLPIHEDISKLADIYLGSEPVSNSKS